MSQKSKLSLQFAFTIVTAILFMFETGPSSQAQTATVTAPFTLEILGTGGADQIIVSGTSVLGEVDVDLDGDGNVDESFSGIHQVSLFGEAGNDVLQIIGPMALESFLFVQPGTGDDRVEVEGEIASWVHIQEDAGSNGNDLVFIRAAQIDILVIHMNGGTDYVQILDTVIESGLNTIADANQTIFEIQDSQFNSCFSICDNNGILFVKFVNCDCLYSLAISGDFSGFSFSSVPGEMLSAFVSNCRLGGLSFVGAADDTALTVTDESVIGDWYSDTEIETFAGRDHIFFSNDVEFENNVLIKTGAGRDRVRIEDDVRFLGDLKIETSVHSDQVYINTSLADPSPSQVLVSGNFKVAGGSHNDRLLLNHLSVSGFASIAAGTGGDRVRWNRSDIAGDWYGDLGSGNDNLAVVNSSFFGSFNANGGLNSDTGNQAGNFFDSPPASNNFESGNLQ